MPAKRPQGDALAVWLIVELLREKPGGTQDAAFTEIRDSLKKFQFCKRGQNPCIDVAMAALWETSYRLTGLRDSTKRPKALFAPILN
jgi:hypothetical protein